MRNFSLQASVSALVLLVLLGPGCASMKSAPPDSTASEVAERSTQPAEATDDETANAGVQPLAEQASIDTSMYPGSGELVREVRADRTMPKPAAGEDVTLNFGDADIREVVSVVVSSLLGETYIIDPAVQGTVNLHTSGPIKRIDLIPILETMLRMNGAAIIWEEGLYKVLPLTAVRGSLTPQLGGGAAPLSGQGYSVRLIPLKFVSAGEMAKVLAPLARDNQSILTDLSRNMLILTGTTRELGHLQDTIDMFDVDWLAGMSVGLVTLQNVDVKTAASELELLFGDKSKSPIAGVVKLIPIERLNALFIITPRASSLESARLWIDRLDRSSGASGGTRLFVYPVQNGEADHIATLLNDIFSDAPSGGKIGSVLAPGLEPVELSSAGGADAPVAGNRVEDLSLSSLSVSSQIRVIADEDNNALLILASPADYEKIEVAIRKLDVVPRQVLIDVMIAEVTLTGDLRYGLEVAFRDTSKRSGKLDTGVSGLAALTPGFSYLWRDGSEVEAAFNLLATDSRVNIISSPHVMVTDNQTAEIKVGDEVPTTSQSQSVSGSATGIISSIQYVDTGVLLSVTPRINAGGLVTMEIMQEVSAASQTTTSGIDSPTISNRSMQTTVVVKSGETMVMGGLITENKSRSSSGLPFLSKLPVIGGLFGAQGYDRNRTELIILITPRMVADSQQARDVTNEIRNKMHGLKAILEELDY